jgi:hypothetical protein
MLKEPTIEKLKALRLDAMAAAWNEQHGKPDLANLSFDERFGMLVEAPVVASRKQATHDGAARGQTQAVECVP